MTNSEKIKAYLDTGHNVLLQIDGHKVYLYKSPCGIIMLNGDKTEEPFPIEDLKNPKYIEDLNKTNFDTISIHQEPLRYPKVGDKVLVLDSIKQTPEIGEHNLLNCIGKPYSVVCMNHTGITIDTVDYGWCGIDCRHLAPYLE